MVESNASSSQPIIAVQGLVKVFKDFWMRDRVRAVDNVTFQVNRGEVFGLLGPNGSGKSTTIKIVLSLLHPTSGRVAVFGKRPEDVETKRRIGYLPEESYLYPFLNARETLEYYARLFSLDRAISRQRIDQLLEMVGLTAVQFRPVREYSKGMQRRIGIAQALINDPELLILDEPTTGLDPLGTRQIKDLIIELGRRGKTIVLSSHLLADVEDCVDRMVILYGGKIRREGTCENLLSSDDRMVIETDILDDATVARIDQVIRDGSHGASAIARVGRQREKLEDVFIRMVEEARAERLETSGAQHGGATAAFLRGSAAEGPSGAELIARLTSAEPEPAAHSHESARARPAPAGPDQDVLGDLLGKPKPAAAATRPSAPSAPPAPASPEVDQGVIGSLLGGPAGGSGTSKGSQADKGGHARGGERP